MAKRYTYSQHPRVAAREEQGPVVSHHHRSGGRKPNLLQRFNNALGLTVTKSVGTMWAAYAFFALTLVSLPAALASGQPLIIVSWVAQTFLQLVLLPIIIVGQNIQAKAADARAIATYEDAGAILAEAKEIQQHLGSQDEALGELIDKVAKLEARLEATSKPAATKATRNGSSK